MQGRVLKVIQETSYKYLNFFRLRVRHKNGQEADYYMASRDTDVSQLKLNKGSEDHCDGVLVYAIYGPEKDKVVLIRQMRYPLDDYVYEFPAGLVEPGEDYIRAGMREFHEETGLTLTPVHADEMFMKPRFTTVGLTDESCAAVYGYTDGIPSQALQEDAEDIQIVIADKAEVRRILKEENVAIMCAYMMMHFLSAGDDPLAFVKEESHG